MKYQIYQCFETLGDPCPEFAATSAEAEAEADRYREEIAADVAAREIPIREAEDFMAYAEDAFWMRAEEIAGEGARQYGRDAGEYIAREAVVIEEDKQ